MENFAFKNWSKTFGCTPELYFKPTDEKELREILRRAHAEGKKVRTVGMGNSPSDLCCTEDFMISMEKFNHVLNVDKDNLTVTVQGGIIVGDLIEELKNHEMALEMVPAIKNLTMAGMVSTASHNTGVTYPVTSGYVTELVLMTADGSMITCSQNDNEDIFCSALAGLGYIGIIIQMKVTCSPLYHLRVHQTAIPFDEAMDNLETIANSSDHTRIAYVPHTDKVTVHRIHRVKPTAEFVAKSFFWDHVIGKVVLEFLYLMSLVIPPLQKCIHVLYQKLYFNQTKTWVDGYENVFNFDCKFSQYVSEWAIPIGRTKEAMTRLRQMISSSFEYPAHISVEIRFTSGDQAYMSPAYGRTSTYINILSYRPYGLDPPGYQKYRDGFAQIIQSLDGRPHLAKEHPFTLEDMKKSFPKFGTFCKTREKLDPKNVFVNKYAERIFNLDTKLH